MKYLQDYVQDAQTQLFTETGAFFAFHQSQFEDQKVEGTTYCSLGHGMIVPKQNASKLVEALEVIHQEGIKKDLSENGRNTIIRRELFNHECFYTGSIESCVDALEDYPITKQEIIQLYRHILESEDVE